MWIKLYRITTQDVNKKNFLAALAEHNMLCSARAARALRSVAGYVQTAAAQVMRYHAHPSSGTGVFHHTWNRRNFTAVMNRPFNWDAMPDVVDGSVPG
ncbi:MAG: C10 family peptidase [Desulfamplus sp.]|nr:C10 family peptidase [Desulfamplus sp.]